MMTRVNFFNITAGDISRILQITESSELSRGEFTLMSATTIHKSRLHPVKKY
jgi:hypothetical protein